MKESILVKIHINVIFVKRHLVSTIAYLIIKGSILD